MCAAPRIDNLNSYNNIVLNGGMDLHQRFGASSVNFTTARVYSADRWCHVRSSGYSGNSTAIRSTDVPTVAQAGAVLPYSLLVTNGTGLVSPGASDFHLPFSYLVEGQDYANIHGQTCRLQFWVRASITGTYSVAFRNNAGNRSYVATYAISAANTWERKTIDITMDTSGTWLFDNGMGLNISFAGGAGSSFQTSTIGSWQNGNFMASTSQTNWAGTTGATIQLAGVMLVKGSFAAATSLPFQRAGKTIGQELAMCQRYYEKSYPINVAPGTPNTNIPFSVTASTTSNLPGIMFRISKCKQPNSTAIYGYDGTAGAVSPFNGGGSLGSGGNLVGITENGAVRVDISASLTIGVTYAFHFTVDAEL